ncbi:MAG: MarR family transcriptional regulator [Candidatus Aureabacteria bacterium]|nr:MarR family transcriptional regulator [Candidatus Auribacterota bacterium]
MVKRNDFDLPLRFNSKAHEALISVWWTGVLLKKESRYFFKPDFATDAQFNIMMIIKYSNSPVTQNDLSERLLVDKSNITGLVDRMEKGGLIQRNKVENDRRSYHIICTSKGKKLIDKFDVLYEKKVQKIMSAFSEKEYKELIRLTKKLRIGFADS